MRANELADRLAQQAESVARYLLPDGKREGREWVCGDLSGGQGKSLKVCISGDKAGVWKDFADGPGGDLLSLWCEVNNQSVSEAMGEVRDYLGIQVTRIEQDRAIKPIAPQMESAPSNYLQSRGISLKTQQRYRVGINGNEVAFPSYVGNEIVWCKYRNVTDKKKMRVEEGGTAVLFGWQAIPKKQRSVIITEGEIDALSWMELGYPALSVPNGANGFGWVETEYNRLERFDRIYVAFDADQPGRDGAAVLIERLGRERCLTIDTGKFKDANEILMAGADASEFVKSATWHDPEELKSAESYRKTILDAFELGLDRGPGFNTPFSKLDGLLRFRAHELTILNGVNGHGKSQFMGQQVLSTLAQKWHPVIYSGELRPEILLTRLIRQATADNEPTPSKVNASFDWMGDKLKLFDLTGSAKSKRLLEVFEYAHKRYGSNVFVVDSLLKCGIADDDYVGQKAFVEELCDFKNTYPVHVFLVTHARKGLDEDKPTGKMDVKGSGSITDLADTVLTIWRNKPKERAKHENPEVYEQEYRNQADAKLIVSKQRNGEWENSAKLWWHYKAQQFLEFDNSLATPYGTQLRIV